jgi:hypothetical protein
MQLEYLCDRRKFKAETDIIAALRTLPPTLLNTFDRLYARIEEYKEHPKQITRQVFAWLPTSERPMSASEIITAVSASQKLENDDGLTYPVSFYATVEDKYMLTSKM